MTASSSADKASREPTLVEQLRAHAAANPNTVAYVGQSKQLLRWAADTIEAANAALAPRSAGEERRLAIIECAQIVNGRLAGRQEGSDLWLEIIKITNMLQRLAGSETRSAPVSATVTSTARRDLIVRLQGAVYGTSGVSADLCKLLIEAAEALNAVDGQAKVKP